MFGLDPSVAASVIAVIGTLVGILAGAFLGAKRNRKETNWALKQQSYVDLVLSLQQMREYYALLFDNSVGIRSYTEAYVERRRKEYDAARTVFQRSRALAFVLLGSDISELLDQLERTIEDDDYQTLADWADACCDGVDGALKLVRERAAVELAA